MASLSRCTIIGAATASAIAGFIAAVVKVSAQMAENPASGDAELIIIGWKATELIKKCKPLEINWWALPHDSGQRDHPQKAKLHAINDALQPIEDRLYDLGKRAAALRANSREAMAAKAHLIRHQMENLHVTNGVLNKEDFSSHEVIVWSLLDDLIGEPV